MIDEFSTRAEALDAADPLAGLRSRFITPARTDVVSYLDGNSLGRPLAATATLMDEFIREQWAGRLIRGWTDGWMEWPLRLGDRLGVVALGAGPGQVVVADSTTVLLYKLARAAVDARPGRRKVLLDTDNFPTDRYVLEGIAAERGLSLVWITTDPVSGISPAQVAAAVDGETALVLFSHVAYRSGWLADAAEINRIAHEAGALTLWDLSHSVGSVPVSLDAWGVDLAVGCTYKYLNGGPGAPAFGYLRRELQDELRQPIWGWMGHRASFEMGPRHEFASGVRALISGTPPILAMVPLQANLDMLAEAGIEQVRAKSLLLTSYVLDFADRWLAPLGVTVSSPRDASRRGGHVTLSRPGFEELLEPLWERGVIPDYRRPDGIRIGPAPLSTSFAEVHRGLEELRALLQQDRPTPSAPSNPAAASSTTSSAGPASPATSSAGPASPTTSSAGPASPTTSSAGPASTTTGNPGPTSTTTSSAGPASPATSNPSKTSTAAGYSGPASTTGGSPGADPRSAGPARQ